MQTMNHATAIGVVLLAGSCGLSLGESRNPPMSGGDIDEIRYVEEYGFCVESCFREIIVEPQGQVTLTVRGHRSQPPVLVGSLDLESAEVERLFQLAAGASAAPWDAVYGCPDCVDQGRFELTVVVDGAVHQTTIDPLSHPDDFDDLLDELGALLDRAIDSN